MKRPLFIVAAFILLFIGWRFIRPLNIFVVDERFAWPVDTAQIPPLLGELRAEDCGRCHPAFYNEWRTTIHSQAWTDPYFQADWQFDGAQHVCRLCHTPLDRQQPHTVLGYRDKDKWDPILKDNPAFFPELQHQGVTCAACHYREGKIVGVIGNTSAPHPVQKLDNPNQVCVRCHIVEGDRWDTFFRFPPCGTVAEIRADQTSIKTGELSVTDIASLGCVQCHMPAVERPLVEGGEMRWVRQHLWRGGHDPAMVKQGLDIRFVESTELASGERKFVLTIINKGAAHYIPTGTPDRFLSVSLRLLDNDGKVLQKKYDTLKRTVMWRPFIVDLWDTSLPYGEPRHYDLPISEEDRLNAKTVEAVVRYHLLDEKRRKRIGYNNQEPIVYEVFRKKLFLDAG